VKRTGAIIFYAAGVFVLSALLAPWCFWTVHPFLENVPFRRVFDRVILVVALAGVWPLLRTAGVTSWREVGFLPVRSWWRQVLAGLGVGVLSYGIAGILLAPSLQWGTNPDVLLKFALSGIAVALIEETFFRGGLQNIFQRSMNPVLAVVVVSAVYSVVHFLKPSAANIPDEAVSWMSGFEYLGRVMSSSFQKPGVWGGVVSLWLAGIVLGWTFLRTKALYLSMGLHAGWVFELKTVAWLGGGSVVNNPAIWPVLILVLVMIEWAYRRKLFCPA
jgi:membrane protease YdiL (CAAX protease family)